MIKPFLWLGLFLLYFLILTPLGLIFKILGKDYLRTKYSNKISSYWIKKDTTNISMKDQFK